MESGFLGAKTPPLDPATHIAQAGHPYSTGHLIKTTLEISTPLLRRAKKTAARDGTTLRALVEEGLAQSLATRTAPAKKIPPLVVVQGSGLSPEFVEGGWEKIRDAIYEGRGA